MLVSQPEFQIVFHFSIECDEPEDDKSGHDENVIDGDLPVQGPLPQDPEDAPFLKNESGIRKL